MAKTATNPTWMTVRPSVQFLFPVSQFVVWRAGIGLLSQEMDLKRFCFGLSVLFSSGKKKKTKIKKNLTPLSPA